MNDNVSELVEKKLRDKDIEKKINETCTGVECLKSTFEKFKGKMETDIEEIKKYNKEQSKKLNTVKCKCNGEIPLGSSYCPNCGLEIQSWSGNPSWKSYKNRR